MRSSPRFAFAAHSAAFLSLLSTATVHAMPSPEAQPDDATLLKRGLTYQGCYSSADGLTSEGTYIYQTSSYCLSQCNQNQAVLGLSNGNACYCGNSLPSTKVDDSQCSTGCDGFGSQKCGGAGFYSVYLTGNGQLQAGSSSDSSSSSPSSSASPSTSTSVASTEIPSASSTQATSSTPTSSSSSTHNTPVVVTSVQPGQTVVVTQSASVQSASQTADAAHGSTSGGSSTNTAGIAAGVVVGIIALGAIVGGTFFYLRHRRRQQVEDEHRQRTQVSDFISGGMDRKDLGTSYSHRSDARLDPEAGRRNSVGSLADNHDYSRKILRVANPDA